MYMANAKNISIDLDAANPRSALVLKGDGGALPTFVLGDILKMSVSLYSGGALAAFDTTKDYVFALGLARKPSAGNYVLTYGADSTPELTASASAAEVEEALNKLASVTAAGGLDVTGASGSPYKIKWRTNGARDLVTAKNTLYPDAQVYARSIVAGGDDAQAQEVLALRLNLLSSMSNTSFADRVRTQVATSYVDVDKPYEETTVTEVTDPETGVTTKTTVTDTKTETVTEAQTQTISETIKGAFEFDLNLNTIEAVMAVGGAANISAIAEFAEIDGDGNSVTLMQAECQILYNVIPDTATLIYASQELAAMTATAHFFAIGTQETIPTVVAGVVPDEADKGSAYYYAQLAANSELAAGSATSEAAVHANDAATSAQNAATKATEAAQSATQAESYAQSAGSAASAAVGFKNDAATSAQNAAASATTAQNAADSAVQAAGVAALQVDKLNDGILYFNTGLVSKVGVGLPDFPFTFCTTINISAQPTENFNLLSISGYEGATGQTLSITLYGNILTLMIRQNPTTSIIYTSRVYDAPSNFWGAEHTIVWIARSLTSGTAPDWSLYIDGAEVTTALYGTQLTLDNITGTGKFGFGGQNSAYPHTSPNATPFTARNVRVFNFDLSATDAPYTLDDYYTGKAMPPTICDPTATQRAIIALDNYTIANGATKYVPDISGNSYDSAVTLGTGGYVKGTNDIRIAKLAQYINLQNA